MQRPVEERDIGGFGTETVGTDYGQARHFNPPDPARSDRHGKGRSGRQRLTNLDRLPSTGAVILAARLKINEGPGRPLRMPALLAPGDLALRLPKECNAAA